MAALTAREMIVALSKLDPETEIIVSDYDSDWDYFYVWSVRVEDAEIIREEILDSGNAGIEE